jgi:hypothetical protein
LVLWRKKDAVMEEIMEETETVIALERKIMPDGSINKIPGIMDELINLRLKSLQDEELAADFDDKFTVIIGEISEVELEALLVFLRKREDLIDEEKLFLLHKIIFLAKISRQ